MAGEDETKDVKPGGERRTRERRQRPPVTIDLTAEPVVAKPEPPPAEPKVEAARESPASSAAETAAPGPAPGQRSDPPRAATPAGAAAIGSDDTWARLGLAAGAGGVVALVLVLALQGIGLLPAPGRSAALAAAEQAKAAADATAALDRRISAIEMITQGLPARGALDALGERVSRIESAQAGFAAAKDLSAIRDDIAGLSAKLASLPPGVTADQLAALAQRVARLEAGGTTGGGEPGADAVASLNARIDSLEAGLRTVEQRIASLEAPLGNATADTLAARAIAIIALRRAADGGGPFTDDLDLAAALGLAATDVAAVKPFAEKGVATKASLAAEFPDVGDAIIRASVQADPNAGFFDRLIAGITGLVSVRPAGPTAGDDPVAIVSRMRAAVDSGDLAAALKEREALGEVGKAASVDWAARVNDRVQLDALMAKLAAAVAPT
jgi:hypothetical protein